VKTIMLGTDGVFRAVDAPTGPVEPAPIAVGTSMTVISTATGRAVTWELILVKDGNRVMWRIDASWSTAGWSWSVNGPGPTGDLVRVSVTGAEGSPSLSIEMISTGWSAVAIPVYQWQAP
jgi:hypothetical protein